MSRRPAGVSTWASDAWRAEALAWCGPGTAFEAGLYELLARAAPDHVRTPLATDAARARVLLPDGGRTLGEREEGEAVLEALAAAVAQYGEVQRALAPHAEEMLVRAAIEQGEPIEERWTTAARETLESLRDEAWLGSG